MSQVIQATDENFETEVESYPGPMLVEFFATWCPHCQRIAPIIKTLSEDYEGKIKFVGVDIDLCPAATKKYKITGTPTLFFFGKEKTPARLSGEQSALTLKDLLDKLV